MQDKLKLIKDTFGADKFRDDVLMADITFLKVGGPTKIFFIAFSQNEIIKLVNYCRLLKVPFMIFGTGSKMMISDKGFDGLVIKNRTRDIKIASIKGKVSKVGVGVDEAMVEVESGVSISNFTDFLKNHGLLYEEFIDMPGTIGGNLFLNQSLQSKAQDIKVLNLKGKVENCKPYEVFLGKHIILSAILKMKAKNI